MSSRFLHILAILLVALALVPAGAHIAALPNKIAMAQNEYFLAQSIYRGWSLFGVVLIAAILATMATAIVLWRRGEPFGAAALAALLMFATLVVFFSWTLPANKATINWTLAPPDWQELRRQWEYAHAAGALLTFLGLCAITWSGLRGRD